MVTYQAIDRYVEEYSRKYEAEKQAKSQKSLLTSPQQDMPVTSFSGVVKNEDGATRPLKRPAEPEAANSSSSVGKDQPTPKRMKALRNAGDQEIIDLTIEA